MRHIASSFAIAMSAVTLAVPASAQRSSPPAPAAQARGRQMLPSDLKAWKSIRQTVLSNDGKWFAYVLAPNEGDATVVIRSTADTAHEMKFPVGEAGRGGRAGAPGADAGAGAAALMITADSKWAAFTISPSTPAAGGGRGGRRGGAGGGGAQAAGGNFTKLAVVNLATGEKKEFPKVRRYAFNGDAPTWVAMQGYPDAAGTDAAAAGAGAGRGGAPAAGAAANRVQGTDVALYNLATGMTQNVGNVAEFAFDDSGNWLAYTIDARDQMGNGVQLRNMKTDAVRPIESDRAVYRHLVWADSGAALAVLKGKADSATSDTLFQVVSVTGFKLGTPKAATFDPSGRPDFPAGMKISGERAPRFSDDLSTVFFGLHELRSPLLAERNGRGGDLVQPGAPGAGGTLNMPRANDADSNPSLVIWHGLDPRLQSQQIVQEQQDRAFSYLASYRLADNKVTRLADSTLRNVNTVGHDHFAYGIDTREYDQPASYSGRRYEDVYSIDLKTGNRTLLMKKHLVSDGGGLMPSPDGKQVLFWGDNAQFWVMDIATGEKHDITTGVPAMFADSSDDHNNLVIPPNAVLGWAKDNSAVLLSDGFDVWKVATKAGAATSAVNLTGNGIKDQIRYQRLYDFAAGRVAGGGRGGRGGGGGANDGVDLTKPLYFATYGEHTKKEGLSRVAPGRAGATSLVWEDAKFTFQRAKDAEVYVYTRQTALEFPNYYLANPDFHGGRQLTDANPQQNDFAWTSGVRLIDYVSDKGDHLQGALYLPANYEPGKKYPLLVTIYEKRSNLANSYVGPSETSTPNRSIYTSRGYAVLDPDIVYRVNDPGMSAVWCVIPAVKAAIATGMVDSSHMGLWGHSWGGYQTAFLVTQTNLFHSAIAGAPLTNMVSMYGSIYWNTGGGDNAIFESSQGRFKGSFVDNFDAYIRNSPVFFANKVTTPLIILADDKDGAVDFNQGITYYNTLRQQKKDVILLEYVGENHGLARPVNMKDYAGRQRDWFDHYLQGAPAPDWMVHGVPRIKMDEYWAAQKKTVAGPIMP